MSEEGAYCTRFIAADDLDDHRRCTCPNCGGFLPNFAIDDTEITCPKCGEPLTIIEDNESLEQGRICMKPDHLKTEAEIKEIEERRMAIRSQWVKRDGRHKTSLVARGLGFYRRVWKDKSGDFIRINGRRIPTSDPIIEEIIEASTIPAYEYWGRNPS